MDNRENISQMRHARQITDYLHWLDVAKGIGILFVIIGHCVFICHPIIDVFHMPLFFLLAGITLKHRPWNVFIISKINRIAVPYIFWMIVSAVMSQVPHYYTGPFNAPLWFLQTIFVAYIIVNCNWGGASLYKTIMYLCGVALFCHLTIIDAIPDFLPFNLCRALMASFYIGFGVMVSPLFLKRVNRAITGICLVLSVILFLLVFIYLYRKGLQGSFVHLTIYRQHYILVVLCSLAGILATIFISQLIGRQSWLEWLGRNSLAIMCVHFPFAQILNVMISHMVWYNTIAGKVILGLIEYAVVTGISVVLAILCKRYIPRVTGYKSLIHSEENTVPKTTVV